MGAGTNPPFALSCVARRLGTQTMFNASIIDLQSGAQRTGSSVNYSSLNEGIPAMDTLALHLSGISTVETAEQFHQELQKINNSGAGNYSIVLRGDISLENITFTENAEKTITIRGLSENRTITSTANTRNGVSISSSSLFTVPKGITLVFGDNLTIMGSKNTMDTLIRVRGGSFILQGATLKGGVYGVNIWSGNFTMINGIITGNNQGVDSSGTFIMNGGVIHRNICGGSGGGVEVSYGTFTMNGGAIHSNTTDENGGGVYVDKDGIFIKTGGTIGIIEGSGTDVRNKAEKKGDQIFIKKSNRKRDRPVPSNTNLDSRVNTGWD